MGLKINGANNFYLNYLPNVCFAERFIGIISFAFMATTSEMRLGDI